MSDTKAKKGTPLAKTGLSGEDLCKIIETCAKKGVSSVKIGDVEVVFQAKVPTATGPENKPIILTPKVMQEFEAYQQKAIDTREVLTREQQISELMLTDPLAAEELMQNGDLIMDEGADGEPG